MQHAFTPPSSAPCPSLPSPPSACSPTHRASSSHPQPQSSTSASTQPVTDSDDDDSIYNDTSVMTSNTIDMQTVPDTILDSSDDEVRRIDALLDEEEDNNVIQIADTVSIQSLTTARESGSGSASSTRRLASRLSASRAAASAGLLQDDEVADEDELIEDEFTYAAVDHARSRLGRLNMGGSNGLSNNDLGDGDDDDSGDPLSDDRNDTFTSMVEVALTPRVNLDQTSSPRTLATRNTATTARATARATAASTNSNNISNDDVRFDSDEHVDVESLSTSDDEQNNTNHNDITNMPSSASTTNTNANVITSVSNLNRAVPSLGPPAPEALPISHGFSANPGMSYDSTHTRLQPQSPSTSSVSSKRPTPRSGGKGGRSFLSRASQSFYKTFIGGGSGSGSGSGHGSRNGGSGNKTPSSSSKRVTTTSSSNNTTPTAAKDSDMSVLNVSEEDTKQYERLCHLLDAQLSALEGAKTGFVQLGLLRPLAEQTLDAVCTDAHKVLGDFGRLENYAERRRHDVKNATCQADEEMVRKERLLIEAKVALAEASGEVERLRGELAATKRQLAHPSTKAKRVRKQADILKRQTQSYRDARAAVEGKLVERRRSLGREKAELSRLENELRDIEGDWA